jgi:hypothetical protein
VVDLLNNPWLWTAATARLTGAARVAAEDHFWDLAFDPARKRMDVYEAQAARNLESMIGRLERAPGGKGADYLVANGAARVDIVGSDLRNPSARIDFNGYLASIVRKARSGDAQIVAIDTYGLSGLQLRRVAERVGSLDPEEAARILFIPEVISSTYFSSLAGIYGGW